MFNFFLKNNDEDENYVKRKDTNSKPKTNEKKIADKEKEKEKLSQKCFF